MRTPLAMIMLAMSLVVLAAPVSEVSTAVSSASLKHRLALYDVFPQDADVDYVNRIPGWVEKKRSEGVDFTDRVEY